MRTLIFCWHLDSFQTGEKVICEDSFYLCNAVRLKNLSRFLNSILNQDPDQPLALPSHLSSQSFQKTNRLWYFLWQHFRRLQRTGTNGTSSNSTGEQRSWRRNTVTSVKHPGRVQILFEEADGEMPPLPGFLKMRCKEVEWRGEINCERSVSGAQGGEQRLERLYIVQETIGGNNPRQVSEVETEWRGGKWQLLNDWDTESKETKEGLSSCDLNYPEQFFYLFLWK